MKKAFAIASLLSTLLISCSKKDVTDNGSNNAPDSGIVPENVTSAPKFEQKEYDGLKYQVLASITDGTEKPIFVIYLHSHNGSGNDNQKQLNQPSVTKMKDYLLGKKIPAYFLAPQCPSDYEWIPNKSTPGCKDKVVGLIKSFVSSNNVDTDRVYICGTSMGGWGVWTILKENKELFAAGFIGSGAAKNVQPEDFKNIPLYVTVGTDENSYKTLPDFVAQIKAAGGTVELTVLQGMDHGTACDNAFTDDRLDWFFKWKKNTTEK